MPDQPPSEKTVTICTGELRAFFSVTVDHYAIIDNHYMACLKYDKYYESAENLELNNKYPWKERVAGVQDGRQLKKLNVAKRGSRIYACPYFPFKIQLFPGVRCA
ncbi:uncharacterized protein LOC112538668 [Tetranychus urticae]|nr:uncharacterized protein LOC112538668 [Tetranychus urticae]